MPSGVTVMFRPPDPTLTLAVTRSNVPAPELASMMLTVWLPSLITRIVGPNAETATSLGASPTRIGWMGPGSVLW